ncbi:hypothetical protein T439DRAFT_117608 [Meredithblackwellia eburnea MCA 4105]
MIKVTPPAGVLLDELSVTPHSGIRNNHRIVFDCSKIAPSFTSRSGNPPTEQTVELWDRAGPGHGPDEANASMSRDYDDIQKAIKLTNLSTRFSTKNGWCIVRVANVNDHFSPKPPCPNWSLVLRGRFKLIPEDREKTFAFTVHRDKLSRCESSEIPRVSNDRHGQLAPSASAALSPGNSARAKFDFNEMATPIPTARQSTSTFQIPILGGRPPPRDQKDSGGPSLEESNSLSHGFEVKARAERFGRMRFARVFDEKGY